MKRLASILLTISALLCLTLSTAHASGSTSATSLSKTNYDDVAEVAIWVADLSGEIVTKLEPDRYYTVTVDFHATSYIHNPQITLPTSLLVDGTYINAPWMTKITVNCDVDGELWQPSCTVTSYENKPVCATYALRSTGINYNDQAFTRVDDEEAFVFGLSPERDLEYGDHFRVKFDICTSSLPVYGRDNQPQTATSSGEVVGATPSLEPTTPSTGDALTTEEGESSPTSNDNTHGIKAWLEKLFSEDESTPGAFVVIMLVLLATLVFNDLGALDEPWHIRQSMASKEEGSDSVDEPTAEPQLPEDEDEGLADATAEDTDTMEDAVTDDSVPPATPADATPPDGQTALNPDKIVHDCERLTRDMNE